MTQCFRCGDDDHLSYDCPNRTPHTQAPPVPWPTAGTESHKTPQPPPFSSLPPRRAPEQIADPQPWADSIREAMGWARDGADEILRELAARQVAESRLVRFDFRA